MIPIIEAEVSLLDLDSMPDTPYKRMLYKQLQFSPKPLDFGPSIP